MTLEEIVGDAFDAISGAIPEVARTVAWSGNRRKADGSARLLSFPVKVIATEVDALSAYADAVAPSSGQAWTLRFLAADWPDETAPHVSDEVRFPAGLGMSGVFNVSAVTSKEQFGYWTVTIRPREVGNG